MNYETAAMKEIPSNLNVLTRKRWWIEEEEEEEEGKVGNESKMEFRGRKKEIYLHRIICQIRRKERISALSE